MNLRFYGFVFVLCVVSDAVTGLGVNITETPKNATKDLPLKPETHEKSQTPIKNDEGPIIVANSPVTVIVPKASEILQNASTTSAPITSSTTPSPPVVPESGRWVIRNQTSNITCVIAQMAMQLNVTYPGLKNQTENVAINVPGNNSNVDGSCSDVPQRMNISWGPGHSIQINFGKNDSAKTFYISGMSLTVNASVFKNVADNVNLLHYSNNSAEFITPLDMSYKCNKMQNISLETEAQPKLKAIVSLSDTQFEAYMNNSKSEFAAAQDCDVFETPDIVPIAVGCALAILVLVVLVAYLIGRKRSQNKGYFSM